MQMVIGCGRGISGMAKNHIKTNIIGWQCVVNCFETPVTSGTPKTVVPTIPENSGSTPTPVLRQGRACARGRGGYLIIVDG